MPLGRGRRARYNKIVPTLLRRVLASVLAAALAAEPALAAGLETPASAPQVGPRGAPVVPAALPVLPSLDAPRLDGLAVPALTEGSALTLPTELPQGALPTATSAAQAAQQAQTAQARADASPRAAAASKPASSSSSRGEFGALAGQRGGELSQRVWAHAEARGFEHEAALAAWENEGGPVSPLPKPSAAPAPEAKSPPVPKASEKLTAMSGRVLGFLSNFLLLQLAVESLALTVPQMTDPLKNGFIALAGLASTSYLAYSTGSFIGGRLVQKLGLARVYRSVLALRTVLWGAVAYVFHAHGGSVPIPILIGFFSGDYLVHSIGRVAERTLQSEWFKDSPVDSNRFGTLRDFIEYGTVFTTMGTGLIIAAFGFGAVIYTVPALFGMAALLATALRSLPQRISQTGRKVPLFAGFKRLFSPALRTIYLSRLLINNFVYLLYYVTATAFGVFFAHGDPGKSAMAASVLIGLLGMGANAAALGNAAVSRSIEKQTESLPESERGAEQSRLMTLGVSRGMKWAALAMLGGWFFLSNKAFGTLAGPVLLFAPFALGAGLAGALVTAAKAARAGRLATKETAFALAKWAALALAGGGALLFKAQVASTLVWPLFALSPALILIGLAGQLVLTQLDTLMSDKMPRRTKAYVVGADRTLTNLSYVFNFMLWGVLFQVFGAAAFWGLGIYCTLTAAAYLWLSKSLARQAK